jgi:NCS2 family nucleobase:cation symporter-2
MAQRDPVDELPQPLHLLAFGAQHVLAMYAGAVAVPLIVGGALGLSRESLVTLINADLFTCGLATLLQTVGLGPFGVRLPIVQGVTFAAVTPMIVIGRASGLQAVYGAIIVAGLLTVIASSFAGRLVRWFPPVVTGSIITIIGVSLLPVAAHWVTGHDPADPSFASPRALGLAAFVLAFIVVLERVLDGFLRGIVVLLGLVAGTVAAAITGHAEFGSVTDAPWLAITRPFAFGMPVFDAAAIASMSLVMLVTMVETTGDFLAVSEIVGRDLRAADVVRGLRADGLATMLGGILNAFPYTAYAQNVGLVGLTRVKSRWVVAVAGAMLVMLGLVPKAAAVVASIPPPVLGGAGIVMFGTVAASGIRTLARVRFEGTRNGMIVAVSIGVAAVPVAVPDAFSHLPAGIRIIASSGITLGSLVAIGLHALLGERATMVSR